VWQNTKFLASEPVVWNMGKPLRIKRLTFKNRASYI